MRTLTEGRPLERHERRGSGTKLLTICLLAFSLSTAGCGEPSEREYKNRRELEALLTAITLKNQRELDKDIQRIEDRHTSGELSDASHKELQEIIKKAKDGDWGGAEKQAYELRESKPFFE